jgi:hypothetical protein
LLDDIETLDLCHFRGQPFQRDAAQNATLSARQQQRTIGRGIRAGQMSNLRGEALTVKIDRKARGILAKQRRDLGQIGFTGRRNAQGNIPGHDAIRLGRGFARRKANMRAQGRYAGSARQFGRHTHA